MSLQTRVLKLLKQHGGVAYKIISANERGVPDILACYEGVFLALEIKEKGDTLKPIQAAQLRRLCKAEGIAETIRDIEQVRAILRSIDDRPKLVSE